MTENVTENKCPCGSDKAFVQCCGRFLVAGERAKTPEQLMRSRYSAYALGGYGDYLLATWFPATAKGLDPVDLSQKHLQWCRLEVLDKSQKGDEGMVEFRAYHTGAGGSEQVMHEKSSFTRVAGRWFYVGGEVD